MAKRRLTVLPAAPTAPLVNAERAPKTNAQVGEVIRLIRSQNASRPCGVKDQAAAIMRTWLMRLIKKYRVVTPLAAEASGWFKTSSVD
jgi:hypothetical protein